MQQLTLIAIAQTGDGILCTFTERLNYDNVDEFILAWLNDHAFNFKETMYGADRICWRLEVEQQIVCLHFDELTQSCWFDQTSEYLLAKLKQIVENNAH
ncbi:DUF3630 family protein [Catenovulum agarivorans]|uniref:DUF3630 family protein n=1 Tax=Catenovulum agarivorans TaxID=1172192 RepID=UPI0003042C77|nr:DUF3630 family protein [Catenovulum agarivorans]